jgi:hypothetical protein
VDPLLGNDRKEVLTATNRHATTEELLETMFSVAATQLLGKHASTTIEELCFLRGPCRDVITGTVSGKEFVVRVLS